MKIKTQKGSISLLVLIALLFYMGFLLLLYASNTNKVQTLTEKFDSIKSIYEKNIDNIDDVYKRTLAGNDNVEPIIKSLPTSVITNVTLIEDSYEEYGPTGGETEYLAFDKTFTSMKNIVNYVIENNKYGEVEITINAQGKNGKIASSTQKVTFIKGMIVTNETELNAAFATSEDLYIYVENDIECTNVINTNNINHKLDLNNHTISFTRQNEGFSFITLEDNANLTILDSSNEKNGVLIANLNDQTTQSDGNNRKNQICTIQNKGILTIESGKVSANSIQKLVAKNDGTNVNNTSVVINNSGTVNVNGGEIYCNIHAGACTYLIKKSATANGMGIINAGTINLNSGNITVNAESSMVRGSMSTIKGKTYAYAYGILNNSGTINNNNIVFNVNAIANSSETSSQTEDAQEIKNN